MKTRSIKTWDEEERPREKLMQQGAASLTNTELLAILLRSGTAEKSAIDLARDVMAISGGRLDALAREEAACLKAIHGIGAAKATAILACFELARRLAAEIPEDELTVRTSLVVARMMGPRLHDLPHRLIHAPPLLRETDARLVAHQKAKAELLFQCAEILRQGALRHAHGLRRLRHRAALHCF